MKITRFWVCVSFISEIGSSTPPSFFGKFSLHYYVCFIYMLCVTPLPFPPPAPPPPHTPTPHPPSPCFFSHVFELLLSICTNHFCHCFSRSFHGSAPWQCQQKKTWGGSLADTTKISSSRVSVFFLIDFCVVCDPPPPSISPPPFSSLPQLSPNSTLPLFFSGVHGCACLNYVDFVQILFVFAFSGKCRAQPCGSVSRSRGRLFLRRDEDQQHFSKYVFPCWFLLP